MATDSVPGAGNFGSPSSLATWRPSRDLCTVLRRPLVCCLYRRALLFFLAKNLAMSTTWPQESLLSSSAVWSRYRMYRLSWCLPKYDPCLKMTLLPHSCNAIAQRFEGKPYSDARLRGNPRLHGRFLGDLYAKGLITMGKTETRVAPVVICKKKGGRQPLIFEI